MIKASFQDIIRQEGFELFKKGLVRRLSSTYFAVKTETSRGWQLVELKNGRWICDCQNGEEPCIHLYAALLHRSSFKLQPELADEVNLKCRYCGSPDVSRCGFRYNARGIARRYRCNDCQRKFSIPYVENNGSRPVETVWILNEIGLLISRLTVLLAQLTEKMDSYPSTGRFAK